MIRATVPRTSLSFCVGWKWACKSCEDCSAWGLQARRKETYSKETIVILFLWKYMIFFSFLTSQIFSTWEKGREQTGGWGLHLEGWHDVTCQYNGIIISWGGARTKNSSLYRSWKGLSTPVSAVLWSSEEIICTKWEEMRQPFVVVHLPAGSFLWKSDSWVLINGFEIQVKIKNLWSLLLVVSPPSKKVHFI